MIKVAIDIYPAQGTEHQRVGTIIITNDGSGSDGSGDSPIGHYDVRATRFSNRRPESVHVRVEDFPRHEGDLWDLLRLVLDKIEDGDIMYRRKRATR